MNIKFDRFNCNIENSLSEMFSVSFSQQEFNITHFSFIILLNLGTILTVYDHFVRGKRGRKRRCLQACTAAGKHQDNL